MKTFFFVLALSIFTNSNIFSQQVIVNGFNINQDGINYIEVEIQKNPLTGYFWAYVDFGQERRALKKKSNSKRVRKWLYAF